MTGYPGWLTEALVDDFAANPEAALTEMVYLTLPSQASQATQKTAALGWRSRIVPHDLGAGGSVARELEGVDTLIHSAAVIHVNRTSDWYRINTQGTIKLAEDAKKAGVRRFVFVSSIAAAGTNPGGRDLVETDPSKPRHHYGISKLRAETRLRELHEDGAFEVVILRPSMFYGPPVPGRHVDVYKRIMHSWMPLVGDGSYKRSVIYISNLVQAVRLAATVERASGQTYLIVDRNVYTTKSVVEAMAEALGVKPKFVGLPALAGQVAYAIDSVVSKTGLYIQPIHLLGESHWNQSASCAKAIAELGFDPKIELREGMHLAVDWCRRRNLL